MEEQLEQRLTNIDLRKEMEESFLAYSMSVIVQRALPDVRDGLKPVHRRILYTMYENSLWPDKAYRKCADTVGSVLGRYHPHGDGSVYDALVRLAQDFSMRYMLVDGHGNFGSVDGDPAAAYRYTEARMSKISVDLLADIDKDTVDFSPNYDDRLKEPTVLPGHYPNLLVNGSTGIAVGMATNIPPHNMCEVIDGLCCLIDNPDASLEELLIHIKGPDFPTAGIIMGMSGIRAAYATGRGKITLRARAEIVEDEKSGRSKIIVTELPYQVNKARLTEHIADLIRDKRIDGISGVNDHSDRNGMHMVVDLKRDAVAQIVLNHLYTYTQMQTTFGVIMLAIVGGAPKTLTLKQILEEYIKFQSEVIVRRTRFNLKKAQDRAHILEALILALDFIDEIIKMLRAAKSIPEGKSALMVRFDFDDVQAQAIVQMRLGQLTGLEREKLEEEMEALQAKIKDFLEILASEARQRAIIKDEAITIRAKYGDERRTEIMAVSGEVDIEDLIPEEECMVTLTNFGYIKRQKLDAYKTQRRGGRGISGMNRRDEDVATEIFISGTHDYISFFSNTGRVYRLKTYEIPESSRTSRGMNIMNLLPLQPEEQITSVIRLPKDGEDKFSVEEGGSTPPPSGNPPPTQSLDVGVLPSAHADKYFIMLTKAGVVKRIKISAFNSARKGGLIAIDLDEGDVLSYVSMTSGEDEVIVASKLGMALRMKETKIREVGRTARGVISMKLKDGDSIVGMAVVREDALVLTVSETGFGRLSKPTDYKVQGRGGKGRINYHVKKYGEVAAIKIVDLDDDIIMISEDGIIIRIPAVSIRVCARPSKGVKVMRIEEGNCVVTLARVPHDDEEEVDEILEDDGKDLEEDLNVIEEDEEVIEDDEVVEEDKEAEEVENDIEE